MKTGFCFDYPNILLNQVRPVQFAIHCEADVVGKPRLKRAVFCAVLDWSASMAGPPIALC